MVSVNSEGGKEWEHVAGSGGDILCMAVVNADCGGGSRVWKQVDECSRGVGDI